MSKPATFSKTYPGADALKAYFRQHGITQVECMFADISGYPRGKLMPAHSFAAQVELRIAEAIMMQAVTGEYSYDPIFPDCDPDVRMVPDYSTLRLSPWSATPRAMVITDCMYLEGGDCGFSPRGLLKQTAARHPVAYIQIANEAQRPIAEALATRLRSFGYEAPGIELVGDRAPETTQVRVQGKSDRSYARWVGKVVGEAVNAVPAQRQAAARHQRNLVRSTLERTRRVVDGRVQGGVAR